ncbi:MAG: hypothetical protein ACRDF4_03240 [Rhabdochlamydiaceae bacterium]
MTDRIHYEKLVSTGQFEHVRLTIDAEVVKISGKDVKELVERTDKWVLLIKRRCELERELSQVKSSAEYSLKQVENYKEVPDELAGAESRFKEIKAKEERILHQYNYDWWDDE